MLIRSVEVERRGPVGWILINNKQAVTEAGLADPGSVDHSANWVHALNELRYDKSIRVIVLTGKEDGEFYRIPRATHYDGELANRARLNPLSGKGESSEGSAPAALQILAHIEKPVIARLNGDAIGAGQSLLWGCDLIIAREDALVGDMHNGMQEVIDSDGEVRGFRWAVTPGDGAMAFMPLYMPPTKVKEYMFLGKLLSARELESMNIVNYAVPIEQLDATLDSVIEALLRRPASVLAHTKRVLNKRLIAEANLTQDLAAAYQKLDFWEHGAAGEMD